MYSGHGRFVDGYATLGEEKHVWEFLGCYFHGCQTCWEPDLVNHKLNKKMGVSYNYTMHSPRHLGTRLGPYKKGQKVRDLLPSVEQFLRRGYVNL